MSLRAPRYQFAELERFVRGLEAQFLKRHLTGPVLDPPTTAEQLDAAAYVVLTHGALEKLVEGLALWVLERCVSAWTTHKRTSAATASVLWYADVPAEPRDKQKTVSLFDRFRKALGDEKAVISDAIYDNNGVSVRHLQSLFYRLGVSVPDDPLLIPSLEKIITLRHQWAHQNPLGARVVTSASDARKIVADCLLFARKLSTAVSALRT